MSWIDDALSDFGRSMGIPDLRFGDNDALQLAFERRGTLFFERLDDGVLMYLVQQVPYPDAELYARALDACHWRHHHPYAVRAGLRGEDALAFAVEIPNAEFQLPAIERALEFLSDLQQRVREGALA